MKVPRQRGFPEPDETRGSIGTTGNYNIGNYNHLQLYSLRQVLRPECQFPQRTWKYRTHLGERTLTSVAVDFQLINRLGLIVEVYDKLTTDMLRIPFSSQPDLIPDGITSVKWEQGN